MTEAKQYSGGCHCGKVRYEVDLALESAISCNCSICSKRGSLLAFAPAGAFSLVAGEGELADYQFNHHRIHHLFCKTCGILSFARGTTPSGAEMVAINIRCLDNLDFSAIPVKPVDGRSY